MTALRTLDLEYSITSLFRDLGSIREATFKPDTVRNAFQEAGIWPISYKKAIKKMRKYTSPKAPGTPNENELPLLPSTPKTLWDSEKSIEEWNNRIPESLSSPSAQRYKKCVKGIKINLARASLREVEYKILQQQLNEQCKQKLTSRKSLQTGGELTGAWALSRIPHTTT